MMPNIFEFNIASDFVLKTSAAIETYIAELDQETIRIALSGGSSPRVIYERLAQSKKINWSKIELYQVDERSDDSNAQLIEETLTSKLTSLKAFHRFKEDYESRLKALSRPLFDLVILGLGQDGHTASLFPHGPELEEVENLVVRSKAPSGVEKRQSLTFPAILSTRKIIFIIRGAKKREIVKKWLSDEGSEEEIPGKAILDLQDMDVYYDYSS